MDAQSTALHDYGLLLHDAAQQVDNLNFSAIIEQAGGAQVNHLGCRIGPHFEFQAQDVLRGTGDIHKNGGRNRTTTIRIRDGNSIVARGQGGKALTCRPGNGASIQQPLKGDAVGGRQQRTDGIDAHRRSREYRDDHSIGAAAIAIRARQDITRGRCRERQWTCNCSIAESGSDAPSIAAVALALQLGGVAFADAHIGTSRNQGRRRYGDVAGQCPCIGSAAIGRHKRHVIGAWGAVANVLRILEVARRRCAAKECPRPRCWLPGTEIQKARASAATEIGGDGHEIRQGNRAVGDEKAGTVGG